MNKYINGGIVKELTLCLKKEEDLNNILGKLKDYINLDLYDMKRYDNSFYFELNDDYVKKNLPGFLKEISEFSMNDNFNYQKKIDYINNNFDKSIDYILTNCDDLFKERFKFNDIFSINSSDYYIDVLCYVFYFDGPYDRGNFNDLVKYIHKLQKKALTNPLKDTLCFGLN